MAGDHNECLTFGHAMRSIPVTAKYVVKTYAGEVIILRRCLECRTVRRDVVTVGDGTLIQRKYFWPEGYGREKGKSRAAYRGEYASRMAQQAMRSRRSA